MCWGGALPRRTRQLHQALEEANFTRVFSPSSEDEHNVVYRNVCGHAVRQLTSGYHHSALLLGVGEQRKRATLRALISGALNDVGNMLAHGVTAELSCVEIYEDAAYDVLGGNATIEVDAVLRQRLGKQVDTNSRCPTRRRITSLQAGLTVWHEAHSALHAASDAAPASTHVIVQLFLRDTKEGNQGVLTIVDVASSESAADGDDTSERVFQGLRDMARETLERADHDGSSSGSDGSSRSGSSSGSRERRRPRGRSSGLGPVAKRGLLLALLAGRFGRATRLSLLFHVDPAPASLPHVLDTLEVALVSKDIGTWPTASPAPAPTHVTKSPTPIPVVHDPTPVSAARPSVVTIVEPEKEPEKGTLEERSSEISAELIAATMEKKEKEADNSVEAQVFRMRARTRNSVIASLPQNAGARNRALSSASVGRNRTLSAASDMAPPGLMMGTPTAATPQQLAVLLAELQNLKESNEDMNEALRVQAAERASKESQQDLDARSIQRVVAESAALHEKNARLTAERDELLARIAEGDSAGLLKNRVALLQRQVEGKEKLLNERERDLVQATQRADWLAAEQAAWRKDKDSVDGEKREMEREIKRLTLKLTELTSLVSESQRKQRVFDEAREKAIEEQRARFADEIARLRAQLPSAQQRSVFLTVEDEIEHHVNAMRDRPENEEVVIVGADSLFAIASRAEEHKDQIAAAGGLGALLHSMRLCVASVGLQRSCVRALWYLTVSSPANKMSFVGRGGADTLMAAMRTHRLDAKVQDLCCRCVWSVAKNEVSGIPALNAAGAVGTVVLSMKTHQADPGIHERAAHALYNMSVVGKDTTTAADMLRRGAVDTVIASMRAHARVPGLQKYGCALLWSVANVGTAAQIAIAKKGGVSAVVQAMRVHAVHAQVQHFACRALGALAADGGSGAGLAVERLGGVEGLTSAMREHIHEAGVQEDACAALVSLASVGGALQSRIGDAWGVEGAVRALRTHAESVAVTSRALDLVAALCAGAHEENRSALLKTGVASDVCSAMRAHTHDVQVQTAGCAAVATLAAGNGAGAALGAEGVVEAGAAQVVIGALRTHYMNSANLSQHALAALFCIVAHGDSFGRLVAVQGGVQLVIRAMRQHREVAAVQAEGCRALRAVTRGDAGAQFAATANDGIQAVLKSLQYHATDAHVAEQSASALANLAFNAERRRECLRLGAVPLLVSAMHNHVHAPPVQAGVFAALWMLALAAPARRDVGRCGGLDAIVVGMLAHPRDVQVQSSGCRLLQRLSRLAENRRVIVNRGGLHAIEAARVAHKRDPALQSVAALALRDVSRENTSVRGGDAWRDPGGEDEEVKEGTRQMEGFALGEPVRAALVRDLAYV